MSEAAQTAFGRARCRHLRRALALLVTYVSALQGSGGLETPDLRQAAATHIIDLAALAVGASRDPAEVARGRGARAARLRAIKTDIVANAGQDGLSAESIATRHGLSQRYVRKLFESEGTSLSAYILGQRLIRAPRMLSDARYSSAFEAGFNDLSYFNRTFRRHFEATPSDIRVAATELG